MSSRNLKFFVPSVVLLAAAATGLVISGVVTPLTPATPPTWRQVHVGMGRASVAMVLGRPQAGGGPEKTMDVWYVTGAIGTRQMFVGYDASDKACAVTEGVYWPLAKRFITKRRER